MDFHSELVTQHRIRLIPSPEKKKTKPVTNFRFCLLSWNCFVSCPDLDLRCVFFSFLEKRSQFLQLPVWQRYLHGMSCDSSVHHMPYKQGGDGYPRDGWWTFRISDGDLSFLRWILILLELGLQIVMMKICGCFSCVFFHFDLAFF